MLLLIIALILIVLCICIVRYLIAKNLVRSYGHIRPSKYHELTKEYYDLCKSGEIDDNTYNDFELDKIFQLIDSNYTGIGQEYLYSLLFNTSKYHDLQEHVIEKLKNKKILTKLLYNMNTLGKAYFPILSINDTLKSLPYYFAIIIFALLTLLIGSILMTIINIDYFSLLVFMVFINIMVNTKLSQQINNINNQVNLLSRIVFTGKKIIKYSILSNDHSTSLKQCCTYLDRKLTLNKFTFYISNIDIFYLLEFIKAIIFLDLIQCLLLKKHRQEVFDCLLTIYEYIGIVDVSLSTNALRNNYDTCIPTLLDKREIYIIDGYHPLLKDPIKNSISITNNILITGSNASGKSTFLKAIGVNMILARCINTAFATEFKYQPLKLISSIHMSDDILKGESYYVREIQVLKKITEYVEKENCLVIIDEILKGTNEKERLIIAKAILKYLIYTESITVVSTHDLYLLNGFDEVDKYCFNDIQKDTSIVYDYILKKGICTTVNAIKLVKLLGFNDEIINTI